MRQHIRKLKKKQFQKFLFRHGIDNEDIVISD